MTIPHIYGPGGLLGQPSLTFASLAAGDLCSFQINVVTYWNHEIKWKRCYPGVDPPFA